MTLSPDNDVNNYYVTSQTMHVLRNVCIYPTLEIKYAPKGKIFPTKVNAPVLWKSNVKSHFHKTDLNVTRSVKKKYCYQHNLWSSCTVKPCPSTGGLLKWCNAYHKRKRTQNTNCGQQKPSGSFTDEISLQLTLIIGINETWQDTTFTIVRDE